MCCLCVYQAHRTRLDCVLPRKPVPPGVHRVHRGARPRSVALARAPGAAAVRFDGTSAFDGWLAYPAAVGVRCGGERHAAAAGVGEGAGEPTGAGRRTAGWRRCCAACRWTRTTWSSATTWSCASAARGGGAAGRGLLHRGPRSRHQAGGGGGGGGAGDGHGQGGGTTTTAGGRCGDRAGLRRALPGGGGGAGDGGLRGGTQHGAQGQPPPRKPRRRSTHLAEARETEVQVA